MTIRSAILIAFSLLILFHLLKNLFSEEAIKPFKESYRFNDDVIFQVQQTVRDLYINPTATSTLAETINSTYPVNNQNADNRYKKFIDTFKNDYPHPFKTLIRWSSSFGAGSTVEIDNVNYRIHPSFIQVLTK